MFFAHLPAGYLTGRALLRGGPHGAAKWTLAAAMVGGVFPDLDLVYLHLFDATPQHHHTYWTHLPVAWAGCALLAWAAARERGTPIRRALGAFLLGWLTHLLLDTVSGNIGWLYPLVDRPYSLVVVEPRFAAWWMNFLLHWSIALELMIVAAALWVARGPHTRRGRFFWPLATMGLLAAGMVLVETYVPGRLLQPVQGATARDWHPDSYWHPHWGRSGVHKGIDIFARRGTPVVAAQGGWVVYRGSVAQGGKVVLVLTPRGWLHYYAHLERIDATTGWIAAGAPVGTVGTSGNAQGKPAHLHYSIVSPVPKPLAYRPGPQGWRRVFYRNPDALLRRAS
jgi:hypothetical protein